MSSIFGKLFTLTSWGESHGKAIGAVVDGCPAGLEISEEYIQKFLDRRRPGQALTTQRKESDTVQILSGVFEGKTTGTPISLIVENNDQRSADYEQIKDWYRPGHADETYDSKYGFRDYRGGGRSSARETIARVAAGSIARKFLNEKYGTEFNACVSAVGNNALGHGTWDMGHDNSQLSTLNSQLRKSEDSIGGIVDLTIKNPPKNLGEPVFDRTEALLAMAMMSIPATKGFEIGAGFSAASMLGSEHNKLGENHAGGVYGGITSGEDIYCRIAFKPTPSISQLQKAKNKNGEIGEISIKGRHDPCVAIRAPVIVESMAALVLMDLWLMR
ncbi:MAG: chorismate synthase [Fibromonadaceae bacterium]|jgi:chorismate synthase|nr:chorismate synthase [Fibromonadaceae bacterium]